jgi:hypothetical protein
MVCKTCGGELAKTRQKNPKKGLPVQELCVRCQLTKLGWKDVKKTEKAEKVA